jgi:phage gpG-like protein
MNDRAIAVLASAGGGKIPPEFEAIVKGELQFAERALEALVEDNFHKGYRPGIRAALRPRNKANANSDRALYGGHNPTDKLFTQTGRLAASLIKGQEGNVSEVKVEGSRVIFIYGIQLDVIKYARIHEYGGATGRGGRVTMPARPYLRPALEAFNSEYMPAVLERILKHILDFLR